MQRSSIFIGTVAIMLLIKDCFVSRDSTEDLPWVRRVRVCDTV